MGLVLGKEVGVFGKKVSIIFWKFPLLTMILCRYFSEEGCQGIAEATGPLILLVSQSLSQTYLPSAVLRTALRLVTEKAK